MSLRQIRNGFDSTLSGILHSGQRTGKGEQHVISDVTSVYLWSFIAL